MVVFAFPARLWGSFLSGSSLSSSTQSHTPGILHSIIPDSDFHPNQVQVVAKFYLHKLQNKGTGDLVIRNLDLHSHPGIEWGCSIAQSLELGQLEPELLLRVCVSQGKWVSFSVPQFLHLSVRILLTSENCCQDSWDMQRMNTSSLSHCMGSIHDHHHDC